MHLVKSHGRLDGLQQRVVGGIHDGIVLPGGGTDIDALGRIGDAGGIIPFAVALAQQVLPSPSQRFPILRLSPKYSLITLAERHLPGGAGQMGP